MNDAFYWSMRSSLLGNWMFDRCTAMFAFPAAAACSADRNGANANAYPVEYYPHKPFANQRDGALKIASTL